MRRVVILSSIGALVALGLIYAVNAYLGDRGRLTTAPEFNGLSGEYSDSKFTYPADPGIEIEFANEFKYMGGQKFILFGAADVEQHFFVKQDEHGKFVSAFLLQFESVRPDVNWQYDYSDSPIRLEIGGLKFFTDTAPLSLRPIFKHGNPGTDFNLERKFLAQKGVHYPKDYLWARLVHLPTEDRRKELLIVFTDKMPRTGLTSKALQSGGLHAEEWPEISSALLDKLDRSIDIRIPTPGDSD